MRGDTPMVASLVIAERFGKRHADVLRAIETLKKDCSEGFGQRNFASSSYVNEQNKEQPMTLLTKDGFAMLVMGFQGQEATRWKERFIAAFNRMERHILREAKQAEQRGTLEWQSARASGKAIRHQATDTVQQFVQYAKSQGSTHANHYYSNFTRMVNTAFLGEQAARDPHFRDNLDAGQLVILAMGEHVAGLALLEAMAMGLPYKDCFQTAKARATAMATLMNGVGRFPQLAGPAANSPGQLATAV
ncbi:MAG: Rha family transcriptional regulator [Magnetococcales bacterium]|nr:Rha family transcriptional regulator [Magnetococcales bacterium]